MDFLEKVRSLEKMLHEPTALSKSKTKFQIILELSLMLMYTLIQQKYPENTIFRQDICLERVLWLLMVYCSDISI